MSQTDETGTDNGAGEHLGPDDLLDLLAVEPSGVDTFVGRSPAGRDRQVYGGQFLGQALRAAAATVEPDRRPHSLHASFLRTGLPHESIDYRVERIRDGRTASHRAVVASQRGREVFRQQLSFQIDRPGLDHPPRRSPTPGLDPATLPRYRDWVAALSDRDDHPWFAEDLPVDLRLEDPPPTDGRAAMTDDLRVWLRFTGPVPDDPAVQASVLAWMSDKTISDVVLYPHGRSWTDEGADILSLDHAMWFHEPAPPDRWFLLTHEAVATRRGRGLARGDVITLDGDLVASVAQEAYIVLPED